MSHAATGPDAGRLRTYALWASLAGVAFFAIYPTLNWLTSLRSHRFHLYLPTELSIPFVPQFIWAYLSMYALLLLPLFVLPTERMPALGKQLVAGTVASGAVFLLLPAELGFVRVIPSDPIYASIYASIFGVDRPHNLVPSLHVVWSSAIVLACADTTRSLGRARALRLARDARRIHVAGSSAPHTRRGIGDPACPSPTTLLRGAPCANMFWRPCC